MSSLSRAHSSSSFLNLALLLVLLLVLAAPSSPASAAAAAALPPPQSRETIVLHTTHGTLELKLWPSVAPRTTAHMLKIFELGLMNTNHFFCVDSGFVAQLADVSNGGRFPLDARQRAAAQVTVPLEAGKGPKWPKHDRAGLISMARQADRDSGKSSFSLMLGPAPHLDGEYTLFGEVTNAKEFENFKRSVEALPTRTEGIFVMPTERVEVMSTYVFAGGSSPSSSSLASSSSSSSSSSLSAAEECLRDLKLMEARWKAERARRAASLP